MKFFKYISALAIGAFALTSCSSDDSTDYSINTAPGVGVSVGESEMIQNEMKGIFQVPLVITGDANGYVKVNVKITGTTDPNQSQAIADSHFYVTSTTVNIPKTSKEGYVEIRTQYLETRDPDLYFNVEIVSAEGATVQPLKVCTVCIQDRLSSPIYQLAGMWDLYYLDSNTPTTVKSELRVIDESTGSCEFVSFAPGLYSSMNLPVILRENTSTGVYDLSIPLGSTIANLNFTGLGACDVRVVDGSGGTSGEIKGTWDANHTKVTFSSALTLGVFQESEYMGYWARFSDMTFTAPQL